MFEMAPQLGKLVLGEIAHLSLSVDLSLFHAMEFRRETRWTLGLGRDVTNAG
jgi:hypothetical protein